MRWWKIAYILRACSICVYRRALSALKLYEPWIFIFNSGETTKRICHWISYTDRWTRK